MNFPRYLFAYGTLLSRHIPTEIAPLMRHLRRVAQGWVRGRLFDLGEYPGAILEKTGNPIYGEVFELPPVQRFLSQLDAYEGFLPRQRKASLFVRERWPVMLNGGERRDCWVYVYKGPLQNARLIPSGRYRARRSARQLSASARVGL
jgi:gamma-glutamylcyclotransferase (GGCT)/AIG2-like uncharacterized protein YtfP